MSEVARKYSAKGARVVADVVLARAPNVETPATPSTHALPDGMIRTAFVDAKPTPDSCTAQVSVNVQLSACTKGPPS
jgi:hypothetical protein